MKSIFLQIKIFHRGCLQIHLNEMIGGSFHGILGPAERCTHNLRIRLPNKSNICLICHCNKINDILDIEVSGNRKLSTANIRDIIHQCRILNSVLDVPMEAKNVETLLSPVLSTSLGKYWSVIKPEKIWQIFIKLSWKFLGTQVVNFI